MTAPDDARRAFVAGLRELATFIETHPDLPLPSSAASEVGPYPTGTDAERREVIERAAHVLDVEPVHRGGGHYVAVRTFGPVAYRAVAVPVAHAERRSALMTYRDAVEPEGTAS